VIDGQYVDTGIGDEARGEPRQEALVALRLLLVRIEGRADDIARRVVDAEQQVAVVLAVQRRFVRERGEVLAELVGSDVVALPLALLRFGRHRTQPIDEMHLRRGHSTRTSSSASSAAGSTASADSTGSLIAVPRTSRLPAATSAMRRARYSLL
jgi:hypothetical protein